MCRDHKTDLKDMWLSTTKERNGVRKLSIRLVTSWKNSELITKVSDWQMNHKTIPSNKTCARFNLNLTRIIQNVDGLPLESKTV